MKPGIYEEVLNTSLSEEIQNIPAGQKWLGAIDPAEAAGILAAYAAKAIQAKLETLPKLGDQIKAVNALLQELHLPLVDASGQQLLGLHDPNDPLSALQNACKLPRPETSMAQSSLFTGSRHEPTVVSEFQKEILSSDAIDLLVSFIKWSGLRRILPQLQAFTERGGHLRVATTCYMGATDLKAIETLQQLPNTEIRISYDTNHTRLHAKAYLFHRNTGFDTAYVGSSNLSSSAISSGLEWNVKVTRQDQPATMDKMQAAFERAWHAPDFLPYSPDEAERLASALQAQRHPDRNNPRPYALDVRPYPYQEQILDALQAQRQIRHCFRNLVVAATGTGKTVIAALDYRRFLASHPHQHRLLFVAHRKEILEQSQATFQAVLKDPNFGDLYVGGQTPTQIDHLFVSIQTLNASAFCRQIPANFYDFVIVDEFHHAAAPSYQILFSALKPRILLGLTATPERMDGQSVLDVFQGRIAAQIRLPEAIDQRLLVPFDYFGITDDVSLAHVAWRRGGYDTGALSRLYSCDEHRAALILRNVKKYVTALEDTIGLGFCVSVDHAQFMAEYFQSHGIPSMALSAQTPQDEREQAKARLTSKDIHFIFCVDLYNEGVDIPQINTVLFLRPTQSLTIFLQQLGRGLRHAPGKEGLTVLDFIGQAHRNYRFDQKFQALLLKAPQSMASQVREGFPSVPKGCFIHLERIAQQYVLENIRNAVSTRNNILDQLRCFEEESGLPLSLTHFLQWHHMEPARLYKYGRFSRLKVQAGLMEDFHEPLEAAGLINWVKLSRIDAPQWIAWIQSLLQRLSAGALRPTNEPEDSAASSCNSAPCVELAAFSDQEIRWLTMLLWTLFPGQEVEKGAGPLSLDAFLSLLQDSPITCGEMAELLSLAYADISLTPVPYQSGILEIGASYSRDQLFLGLGFDKPQNIREGVKWLPEQQTDVLLVTLNKSEKEYSPTTLYEDYSINEHLFHWQSQSTTSEFSTVGQRYIHHAQNGSSVLLFVRETKNDPQSKLLQKTFSQNYTFLGPVTYQSHTGSRPMSIVWKMEHPIPAKFLAQTDKLQ